MEVFNLFCLLIGLVLFFAVRRYKRSNYDWYNVKENNSLNHDLNHDVIPAFDYPFAKEIYPDSDERHTLIEEYKNILLQEKNIEIYNCKIEILSPHGIDEEKFYNVYLYFCSPAKILGEEFNEFEFDNSDFTKLFHKALEKHPIKKLQLLEMNGNGVFIEDFDLCAKDYALERAWHDEHFFCTIQNICNNIVEWTSWSGTAYFFFKNQRKLDRFLNYENVSGFKKQIINLLEKFDDENILSCENTDIFLQDHHTYIEYGQHFFNSDAMDMGYKI